MPDEQLVIAQLSDIHCGDARFDANLMESLIEELEQVQPDVVVVSGDLTADGFAEQFQDAQEWIEQISCANKIVIPGNHDARNVGLMHYTAQFAPCSTLELPMRGTDDSAILLACDTSKADLNQGEFGPDKLRWLSDTLRGSDAALKVLCIHHHLVSVPGTGRERNILWDAGDALEVLSESKADIVLCGHRHVPYVWELNGMVVAMSGTACTHRTRGRTPPSFNILRVWPDEIEVVMRNTGALSQRTATLARRSLKSRKATPSRRGTALIAAV